MRFKKARIETIVEDVDKPYFDLVYEDFDLKHIKRAEKVWDKIIRKTLPKNHKHVLDWGIIQEFLHECYLRQEENK